MDHTVATWAFYSLATLFSFTLIFRFLSGRRKHNLPPGPTSLPIIGNLHLMGSLPHRSLHNLSKQYGTFMHLRFGSVPVVVASSSNVAKLLLKTHDLTFASRPPTAAGKHTTYNYSDIAWAPYGPYWRMARKICAMELLSASRLQSFEHVRAGEVRSLIAGIFESVGNAVNLKARFSAMTFAVISRIVFGKVTQTDDLIRMFDEFFLLNGVLNFGDYIPLIDFMDLQGYVRRMKAVNKKIDGFLEEVIAEHKEKRSEEEGNVDKDMVDVLLHLAEDSTLEIKLTMDCVKAFIQDIILGGTETSSVTLEWAMSELIRHPEILACATDELDRTIGKERWVEEKDLQHLPYMESVVKESMRLHPAAPLLIPHYAREDCVISPFDIPSGSLAIVNVWAIGRDPEIWEEPSDFRPERFLGKEIDVKGHHYELLPFGAGRRMCPGYSLGLKVVQLTLANLVHGFTWRLPEGLALEDLCMEEGSGLSMPRKVPLEAVPKPRLPQKLYLYAPS